MEEYGYYLDILAVSCDSFNEDTNEKIGRRAKVKCMHGKAIILCKLGQVGISNFSQGRNDHLQIVSGVRDLCEEFNVMFKLNTVVNRFENFLDSALEIKNLSNTQHILAIISCNYYSRHNFEEDMSDKVSELNPVRWKVFQCLPIEAENRGPEVIQDSNMPNVFNLNFKHSLISCFRLSDKWTLS